MKDVLPAQRIAVQLPQAHRTSCQNADDLAREAVGCNGVFGRSRSSISLVSTCIDQQLDDSVALIWRNIRTTLCSCCVEWYCYVWRYLIHIRPSTNEDVHNIRIAR